MERSVIPVHRPSADQEHMVWTETIDPAAAPVRNSVHRHSYHEIFLFTSGTGRHMIDLEPVEFKAPCIHFVAPGQVHQLERSADTTGAVIMYSSELRSAHMPDAEVRSMIGGSLTQLHLKEQEMNEAMLLFGALRNELLEKQHAAARVAELYLSILLLKICRWSVPKEKMGSGTVSDVVAQFLALVDRDFLVKKQVGNYASELAISAGHLNELVKKRTGRNASDILYERTLLEAKRLLLHSALSVKEVSFSLHMEDPAYFTRMFRKATGMTPGEYRSHIREKYQH